MAQRRHGINSRTIMTGIFAVSMTASAFYLLHHFSDGISLSDVINDIRETSNSAIALSIAATIVSFTAIAFYEILAVKTAAPGRVGYATAAWAGIAGFAISDVAGFHVLTGGALRYRIYSRKGLEIPVIAQIVALAWMSLWLGMFFLIGAALAFYPGGLAVLKNFPDLVVQGVGFAVLAAFAAYLIWTTTGDRAFTLRGVRVNIPRRGTSLLQLLAGIADIVASATALYFLLPSDVAGSMTGFFVIYISAVILGAMSHSPGGLGVFEATMMAGLGAVGRSDVIGALVLYRVIYYFLPLVPVAGTMLVVEIVQGHRTIRQSVQGFSRLTEPLVPPLTAIVTFIGGVILLLSGSLPASTLRLEWFEKTLPLPFLESSHLLASLIGLALLVMSHALLRRRERAYFTVLILLAAGAVFALARGLDYEEAALMIIIILFLLPFRRAFYRKSGQSLFAITPAWLAIMTITAIAATWLGFFAYRHVEYSNQLWWQFSWSGEAPRFLRTSVAVFAALFALGLHMILNRRTAHLSEPDAIPDSVRRLVEESPNPETTIALLGDKRFLVSEDEKAFLMYDVSGGSYVAMGDPVGERAQAEALAWQLREIADQGGYRAVFYSVGSDYLPLYLDMGLSVLKIGEVARVDVPKFTLEGHSHRDMRHACNKAERDGLVFSVVPKEEVPAILPDLKEISDEWLAIKSGSEKSFSVANFRDDYMRCFDCAVVRKDDRIVAFANILRGSGNGEISIDLMRYRPNVSQVLMNYLFAELLLYAQKEGYEWFSLGAAPLSGLSDHPLASSWNRIGTMIYQHGEEIYHFEGLRAFKQKFDPVWSPNYIACPGGMAVPKVLFDVTALVSGGRLKAVRR